VQVILNAALPIFGIILAERWRILGAIDHRFECLRELFRPAGAVFRCLGAHAFSVITVSALLALLRVS
jgi:hypothetical protein